MSESQIETEWQFEADDLERVRSWLDAQPAHAPLRFSLRKDAEQVDAYFDTADWRLYFAGYSLRRRRRDGAYEVTLKSLERAPDGPISRREINEPSSDGVIPGEGGPVSDRVRTIAGPAPLGRLFEVRTRRRSYSVDAHADAQAGAGPHTIASIELDETTIAPLSGPATTFRRVEVETTDGLPGADLESFVQAMRYANHLVPTTTSKFEAGLGAASMDPHAALDFGPTKHDEVVGAAEFAYARLREHWAAFLRHAPGTRLGEDIEALHQMRVATRRLRATIRVFDAVLPPVFEEHRAELQWAGHELGAVRDLDVQIDGLERLRAESSWEDAAALRPLIEVIEAERREERVRLLELLNSARFEALVRAFSATLRQGPPLGAPSPEVHAYAAPILAARVRRVRKDGRALKPDSPSVEYHELRIKAKRLRYSLEIFGELYGRPAERMTVALKTLQDMLGDHQDAEVGIQRLHAIVAEHGRSLPPETLVAIGSLIERYRQQERTLRGEFPRDFRAMLDRWRPLARASGSALRDAARRTDAVKPVRSRAGGAEASDADGAGEIESRRPSDVDAAAASSAPAAPPAATEAGAAGAEASPRASAAPSPWSPPAPPADGDGEGTLSRMRQLFHRD
ncbi:MAG: CHAD domain-containing protein [Dehalococcoidia bacterium]